MFYGYISRLNPGLTLINLKPGTAAVLLSLITIGYMATEDCPLSSGVIWASEDSHCDMSPGPDNDLAARPRVVDWQQLPEAGPSQGATGMQGYGLNANQFWWEAT